MPNGPAASLVAAAWHIFVLPATVVVVVYHPTCSQQHRQRSITVLTCTDITNAIYLNLRGYLWLGMSAGSTSQLQYG